MRMATGVLRTVTQCGGYLRTCCDIRPISETGQEGKRMDNYRGRAYATAQNRSLIPAGKASDERKPRQDRWPRARFGRPGWLRLPAAAQAHTRRVQFLLRGVQLYLTFDRDFHPVRPGPRHDRRCV